MSKLGVMVCGHGSRDADAVRQFQAVTRGIAERLPQYDVESGFLEFATPIIREGLDGLVDRGVTDILAIPAMLFAAGHVKNDVPSVLNAYAVRHPGILIRMGRDLAIDLKMIRAAGERVQDALDQAGDGVSMAETLLMVIGRGSSDPDANSGISKITRLLWEGKGFGWAETGYSGVTFPLTEPALEHAAKLGYKRIVVFPYFLFTGILVKRIYRYVDVVAARHPKIEFIKASYLNDHPLVLDTFAERVGEILDGTNAMNCGLCKYREQALGFEDEVGLVQESHHHHHEGVGVDEGEPRDHGHSHSHGHGHGHHPYPHADHPLGPKSMKSNVPNKPGDEAA